MGPNPERRAPRRSGSGARSRADAKKQTRDDLIAAALELFAEEGLDVPSLDAICERAGYTRGAFYVHFHDRDALLVAVMEKVGEAFLANVFAPLTTLDFESGTEGVSRLGAVAQRFVDAILAGDYPLMAPPAKQKRQIRFHQLLDACARSPIVRARYRALVDASIEQIAELARADRAAGVLDPMLDPKQIGTMMLATILGAQTMAELGVPVNPRALAATLLTSLEP